MRKIKSFVISKQLTGRLPGDPEWVNYYFKDFTLSDYKFIVINRRTLTPLVWNFTSTQITGELHLGKDGQIVIRDPFAIGEELSKYLLERPIVPNGINLLRPNNLEEWINKV
jgi:hypothetical protein